MPIFLALLVLSAGLLPITASASETPERAQEPSTGPSAGVRAYFDPAIKQLATPPEGAGANRPEFGPRAPDFNRTRQELLADGTVLLHPNGQFRTVSVVRRAPDGSFKASCEPLPADTDADDLP
jgi:hypothetical protein